MTVSSDRWALTLKDFADKASVIRGTDSNSLSAFGMVSEQASIMQPTNDHVQTVH